jgi:tRNA A58 N-methylase Trm61
MSHRTRLARNTLGEFTTGFDEAAESHSPGIESSIVRAYDFSGANCVIDIGGGSGHFMSALLRAHPQLRGVLLERVPTSALAWREMKHAGLTHRCDCVAGNFFDAVPGGGDIYTLKNVLCDWNDSASVAILRRCRAAMAPHARLVIIENILDLGHGSETPFDIHMLIAAGGHVRTEREYAGLLNEAGFGDTRAFTTRSYLSLIEASR